MLWNVLGRDKVGKGGGYNGNFLVEIYDREYRRVRLHAALGIGVMFEG